MSHDSSLFSLAATATIGFVMAAAVLLGSDLALAADAKPSAQPKRAAESPQARPPQTKPAETKEPQAKHPQSGEASCSCPQKEKMWARPKFAELPATPQHVILDETDEIAALESVQFALSEVGDGASYIWHRNNGRLSGMVQPVSSFKDGRGQVCRHLVIILTTGALSKKTEGVACRLTGGQWKLEG
jgi:hypothetical protein